MSDEVMVSVYKIISVMEACAYKSADKSINSIFGVKGLGKTSTHSEIRRLRNTLVHNPLGYSEAYTLLKKVKADLRKVLASCSNDVGLYSADELDDCVKSLLAFLKENK